MKSLIKKPRISKGTTSVKSVEARLSRPKQDAFHGGKTQAFPSQIHHFATGSGHNLSRKLGKLCK